MIISKLSIDNAVKRQIYSTSFEDKDFLGSKEFISKDSKKQSFSLKNHFINRYKLWNSILYFNKFTDKRNVFYIIL